MTRSSAIAGRPCDAKACKGLLKWTWKWQPRPKWPSNVLQDHQKWHQSKASVWFPISTFVTKLTFAVSRTVFEKFDVKQSNDLEICPRSLTVVSSESCRVDMYVKCSEDSEWKKRKSPFSTTTLSFDAPSPGNTANIYINLIPQETTFPGLHSCSWQYMGSSANQFCPKAGDANPSVTKPETDFNAKWPFKVIQGHLFWYHWRATKGLHSTI